MDWAFLATAATAGLFVGSFLNVVIHRGVALWGLADGVPSTARGDFVAPRSYCPSCGATIDWRDLLPVVSYLRLRGRCRACGDRIPPSYPLIEIAAAGAATAAVAAYGMTAAALLAAAALFLLIAIAEIDRRTLFIPDALSQPLLWTGLLANLDGRFAPLGEAVVGAASGFVSLWLIAVVYRRLRGRDGLGDGDAVLLAAIGAWVGWRALPMIVFIAAVATLAVVAAKRLRRGSWEGAQELPFGPGLAAAGALAILCADVSRTWLG